MKSPQKPVVVAQFAGTHGVRGDFKIRSFTEDPEAVFAYGPLAAEGGGPTLTPRPLRELKPGLFLCRADEFATPEALDPLKGRLLTVPRTALPDDQDEDDIYIADLIGLDVRLEDGTTLGTVRAVPNFGAGDILEVRGDGGAHLIPFTREAVPEVRLAEGYVTAVLPTEEPPATDA
jgi:16S rRNA processing protein RimM